MRVQVQKWGNSLALRIPKPFAEEAEVREGTFVNLSVSEGRLVAAPVPNRRITLKGLVSGIAESNLHGETDTGPSIGRESW